MSDEEKADGFGDRPLKAEGSEIPYHLRGTEPAPCRKCSATEDLLMAIEVHGGSGSRLEPRLFRAIVGLLSKPEEW